VCIYTPVLYILQSRFFIPGREEEIMVMKSMRFNIAICCVIILASSAITHSQAAEPKPLEILASLEKAVGEGNKTRAAELATQLRSAVEEAGTPLVSGTTATFLVFPEDEVESVRVFGPFGEKEGNVSFQLKEIGQLNIWIARYELPANSEIL
jgi:hypothetical protein